MGTYRFKVFPSGGNPPYEVTENGFGWSIAQEQVARREGVPKTSCVFIGEIKETSVTQPAQRGYQSDGEAAGAIIDGLGDLAILSAKGAWKLGKFGIRKYKERKVAKELEKFEGFAKNPRRYTVNWSFSGKAPSIPIDGSSSIFLVDFIQSIPDLLDEILDDDDFLEKLSERDISYNNLLDCLDVANNMCNQLSDGLQSLLHISSENSGRVEIMNATGENLSSLLRIMNELLEIHSGMSSLPDEQRRHLAKTAKKLGKIINIIPSRASVGTSDIDSRTMVTESPTESLVNDNDIDCPVDNQLEDDSDRRFSANEHIENNTDINEQTSHQKVAPVVGVSILNNRCIISTMQDDAAVCIAQKDFIFEFWGSLYTRLKSGDIDDESVYIEYHEHIARQFKWIDCIFSEHLSTVEDRRLMISVPYWLNQSYRQRILDISREHGFESSIVNTNISSAIRYVKNYAGSHRSVWIFVCIDSQEVSTCCVEIEDKFVIAEEVTASLHVEINPPIEEVEKKVLRLLNSYDLNWLKSNVDNCLVVGLEDSSSLRLREKLAALLGISKGSVCYEKNAMIWGVHHNTSEFGFIDSTSYDVFLSIGFIEGTGQYALKDDDNGDDLEEDIIKIVLSDQVIPCLKDLQIKCILDAGAVAYFAVWQLHGDGGLQKYEAMSACNSSLIVKNNLPRQAKFEASIEVEIDLGNNLMSATKVRDDQGLLTFQSIDAYNIWHESNQSERTTYNEKAIDESSLFFTTHLDEKYHDYIATFLAAIEHSKTIFPSTSLIDVSLRNSGKSILGYMLRDKSNDCLSKLNIAIISSRMMRHTVALKQGCLDRQLLVLLSHEEVITIREQIESHCMAPHPNIDENPMVKDTPVAPIKSSTHTGGGSRSEPQSVKPETISINLDDISVFLSSIEILKESSPAISLADASPSNSCKTIFQYLIKNSTGAIIGKVNNAMAQSRLERHKRSLIEGNLDDSLASKLEASELNHIKSVIGLVVN